MLLKLIEHEFNKPENDISKETAQIVIQGIINLAEAIQLSINYNTHLAKLTPPGSDNAYIEGVIKGLIMAKNLIV